MSMTSATKSGIVSTTFTACDEQSEANGSPANKHAIAARDPFQHDVKNAFSRASNVIRESIEVEGALFLEASVGSFGGLSYGHKAKESTDSADSPLSLSSGNESQARSVSPPPRDQRTQICDVLGFSTGQGSSIDKAISSIERVPERLLSALLRRYPAGKIFNFDLDGSLLSGDSDLEMSVVVPSSRQESPERPVSVSVDKHRKKEVQRYHTLERQAKAISSIFPGARSVAVVPLWDSVRDRWHSGGVFWTNSPTRIFTVEGELSYLRAFGTTLMGEVARLKALASDKSKSK